MFEQLCQLAEIHARELDTPLTLMDRLAWVGGGAPGFLLDLASQRQRMQGAWLQAMQDAALAVVLEGGPRLAPPEVTTSVAAGSGRGRLTGVDPALLAEVATSLSAAAGALEQAASALTGQLAALGAPSGPAQVIGSAGEWAGAQARMLRRRLAEFEAAYRDLPLMSPRLAAFGLFGGYTPGLAKASALLDEAATGNAGALGALLRLQQTAASRDLADEVNAWWQLLPGARQQKLITDDPAVVGWLDGLPATARDTANRAVFRADYASLEAQKAMLEAETRDATSGISGIPGLGSLINDADGAAAKQAQLTHIEGILHGMAAIAATLGQPGEGQNGLAPVYLLGFNDEDLGHVILSIGDPDTANNVVTYVPGLGSGFPSTTPGDLTRTTRLWRQASDFAPSEAQVASVYWLNYNAPQLDLKPSASSLSPETLTTDAAVASTADAKAGASALDSFAAGLAAAHEPSFAAHTVMLGHSYGSLVVGEAAVRWPGDLADDLAFVGSPGVGVDKAADLGVPAGHVFAGEAANDPVPRLPPDDLPGWLLDNDDSSHFGTNPATPQFGGEDFYVAPGNPVTLTDPIGAHSQYWDVGSVSLKNLARIVDGQFDSILSAASQSSPVRPQMVDSGDGMPGGPYP